MSNKSFVILMLSMMTLFVVIMFTSKIDNSTPRMSHDRISFLRDSLEMEYYKKQLESYPYDHSEIKDTTVIK